MAPNKHTTYKRTRSHKFRVIIYCTIYYLVVTALDFLEICIIYQVLEIQFSLFQWLPTDNNYCLACNYTSIHRAVLIRSVEGHNYHEQARYGLEGVGPGPR